MFFVFMLAVLPGIRDCVIDLLIFQPTDSQYFEGSICYAESIISSRF